MAKSLAPMTESQWFDLFENGLRSLGDRLPQAMRLNGTGEQWIQAQLSLYAWYQHDMEIWSGTRSTQEPQGYLFTHDGQMAVEIKYLRKGKTTPRLDSQPSANDSSISDDVARLKSLQGYQHRFVVVVAADGAEPVGDQELLQNAVMQRQFAIQGSSIRVCRV